MEQWLRWIRASAFKYLKSKVPSGWESLVEGAEERTTVFMDANNRIEIRLNGPSLRQSARHDYDVDLTVNILVTSHLGDNKNVYDLEDVVGIFVDALYEGIPTYKYGTSPNPTAELFGCLKVTSRGKGQKVNTFFLGEINTEDRLRQAGVDTTLNMNFSTR